MRIDKLSDDIKARTGLGRAFQFMLVGSVMTNIMLAGSFMTIDKTQRTIMVPPQVSKSFWVDGQDLSAEYIEQMGTWVVDMFATVSPASVDYKNAQLLKMVHPGNYGELQLRFTAGAMRLKSENMSKVFMPREVRIDQPKKRVAFIGTQDLWIGDKKVSNGAATAYVVGFEFDGSYTTLRELRESSPTDPWTVAATDAPVVFNAVPPSNLPVPVTPSVPVVQPGVVAPSPGVASPSATPALSLPPAPVPAHVSDPSQPIPQQVPAGR